MFQRDEVGDLLASDYVIETGQGPSVGGKPPTNLSINDSGRQLVCLDLSGAEFTGALVDLRGTITCRVSAQLAGQRGEAAIAVAAALIDSLLATASSPVLGISIGTPGLVDPENGIVLRSVNLGWLDIPLRSRLAFLWRWLWRGRNRPCRSCSWWRGMQLRQSWLSGNYQQHASHVGQGPLFWWQIHHRLVIIR